jgi:hypothetical protein
MLAALVDTDLINDVFCTFVTFQIFFNELVLLL